MSALCTSSLCMWIFQWTSNKLETNEPNRNRDRYVVAQCSIYIKIEMKHCKIFLKSFVTLFEITYLP